MLVIGIPAVVLLIPSLVLWSAFHSELVGSVVAGVVIVGAVVLIARWTWRRRRERRRREFDETVARLVREREGGL